MKDYNKILENQKEEIKNLLEEIKRAEETTKTFLNLCLENNIMEVAIGVNSDKMERCKDWPFNHNNSVFTNEVRNDLGYPAIWKVVGDMNIGAGCGNSMQYSIDSEVEIMPGYYEYRDGQWNIN